MQEKKIATNGGVDPISLMISFLAGKHKSSPIKIKRHNPYINKTLHSLDGALYAIGRGGALIRTKRRDGDERPVNRSLIHNKRTTGRPKHNHHKGI